MYLQRKHLPDKQKCSIAECRKNNPIHIKESYLKEIHSKFNFEGSCLPLKMSKL